MWSHNAVCPQVDNLLDSKSDVSHWDLALRVVKNDLCLTNFIGEENIFGKSNFNFGGSLVHAAPCWNFVFTDHIDVLLKCHALSDNKHLLVDHFVKVASCVQLDSDCVLYLTFRFLPCSKLLIEEWRWDALWQLKSNGYDVVTWSDALRWEWEDWSSVAKDLSSPLSLPEVDMLVHMHPLYKGALLFAPNTDFNELGINIGQSP